MIITGLIVLSITGPTVSAEVVPISLAQEASPTPTFTPTPQVVPISGTILVEREMEPSEPVPGQEVEVRITLKGRKLKGCIGIPLRPVDAMMVFDVSSSAGTGPRSNWARTVELTQILLDHLSREIYKDPLTQPQKSRVGLITSKTGTFGPEPFLLQSLTDDFGILRDSIAKVQPSGDTDLAAGLRMARKELENSPDDRVKAVLLMLHDNTAIDESLKAAIKEVQGEGISVYMVVNSLNIASEKRITPELVRGVIPEDHLYIDPEPEDLVRLFLKLTEGGADLAAAGIVIIDELNPAEFISIKSIEGEGQIEKANRVRFYVKSLGDGDTVDLSYRFQLNPLATGKIQIESNVFWLECNGLPSTSRQEENPRVATPTPSPSLTPTALSPTPTLTPGRGGTPAAPAGPGPSPTPPGLTPPPGGGISKLMRLVLGIKSYLWLLLLLLPLIGLLFYWLMMRKRSRTEHTPKPKPSPQPESLSENEKTKEPVRGPEPQGVTHDWVEIKDIKDKKGYRLKFRLELNPKEVERTLQNGEEVKMVLRLDEPGEGEALKQIASMYALLEPFEGAMDPVTGKRRRETRVRIEEVQVLDDKYSECGMNAELWLLEKLLEKLEEEAKRYGATEIYKEISDEKEAASFRKLGYELREKEGKKQVYKKLSSPG